MIRLKWILLIVVLQVCFPSLVNATSKGRPVGQIEAPVLIPGSLTVEYPTISAMRQQEAWVELIFMVSKDGHPFDIRVLELSGHQNFATQAVEAVSNAKYQPATLDGVAVDSSVLQRFRFELRDSEPAASKAFVRKYRLLMRSIDKGDLKKTHKMMKKLVQVGVNNLYEDAYLNLAKFKYAVAENASHAEQLGYLSRALEGRRQEKYLPKNLFLSSLKMKFSLEVLVQDYAAARNTYTKMAQLDETGDVQREFQELYEQIDLLRREPLLYGLEARVGRGGTWNIDLFLNRFSLHDINGQLDELKLYCSARHAVLPVVLDREYIVPEAYGDCTLTAIGKPDTEFTLQQFTAELPAS